MSDPRTSTVSTGRSTSTERGLGDPAAPGEAVDAVTGADRKPSKGGISEADRGLGPTKVETSSTARKPPTGPDPAGRYVDDFFEAIYDPNDAEIQGQLSRLFTVHYGDGTKIQFSIEEIGDEQFPPPVNVDSFFVVGRGGRTFPHVMNRGTVANLWAVKQWVQIVIEEFNADLLLIMSMSMVAISFVLPPPTAGLPWNVRITGPGKRPLSHKINDKIDVTINRIRKRLGKPHIPEDPDAFTGPPPPSKPIPKRPYALLPNGQEVPPDHYGAIFYGNHEIGPEDVVRAGGLPAKAFGENRELNQHTLSGRGSAFRGGSPYLRSPGGETGQGAAEWAVNNADVGWAYEIRGVPVWELNQHLEGRIPGPLGGFRSSRPGTSGEVESVFEAHVPLQYIQRVWRVTKIEGKVYTEELDWIKIKETTQTVPSSL